MRPAPAVAVLNVLALMSCLLANEAPDALNGRPRLEDHDWTSQLSGLIPNRRELMARPRVIFGYLSDKDWAFTEFMCFMHASWRYVTSLAKPTGHRIDLLVFADSRWLREAAALCELQGLEELTQGAGGADGGDGGRASGDGVASTARGAGAGGACGASGVGRGRQGGGWDGGEAYPQLRRRGNASTCWVVPYPRPPDHVWHGYPFVASYHFLADPRVAQLLTANYGYAMKTDFDCFITPTLIHHFPTHLEVGAMRYTPLPQTRQRLQQLAAGLGLRHRGIHDIGPTWYGDVPTLVALANASLPLVHHLLDSQFGGERGPGGGWRRSWATGEGWPLWSRDMAVMYAPDLVLNHMVETFEVSSKYDVHGDSGRFTFALYHIHCQHGDGDFSKFEFFKHKYQDRDISSGLDFNLVRDYSLFLSVTTWRQLWALQAAAEPGGSSSSGSGSGSGSSSGSGDGDGSAGGRAGVDAGAAGDYYVAAAPGAAAAAAAAPGGAPVHSEL